MMKSRSVKSSKTKKRKWIFVKKIFFSFSNQLSCEKKNLDEICSLLDEIKLIDQYSKKYIFYKESLINVEKSHYCLSLCLIISQLIRISFIKKGCREQTFSATKNGNLERFLTSWLIFLIKISFSGENTNSVSFMCLLEWFDWQPPSLYRCRALYIVFLSFFILCP